MAFAGLAMVAAGIFLYLIKAKRNQEWPFRFFTIQPRLKNKYLEGFLFKAPAFVVEEFGDHLIHTAGFSIWCAIIIQYNNISLIALYHPSTLCIVDQ